MTNQTIVADYCRPTPTRGSRVRIKTWGGHTRWYAYDHSQTLATNCQGAAMSLCGELGWLGLLCGGGTDTGMVFVLVSPGYKMAPIG